MAKFTFRLDPVLDHRQRLEDEQQRALAAALVEQRRAEAQRDADIARRRDVRERLNDEHGTADGRDLRAGYAHCEVLDRSIVAQQATVDRLRARSDAERAKLVLKVRDRNVLEMLKARRKATFESAAAALEERESDEINSRRSHCVTPFGTHPS